MRQICRKVLITLGLLGAFAAPSTVFAAESDVNGDGYHDGDVAAVNEIIDDLNLPWEKDAPETWTMGMIDFQNGIGWSNDEVKRVDSFSIRGYGVEGELDVTKLTNLSTLACESNNLKSLNVNNLSKLDTLRCDDNELTELNISSLKSLVQLSCDKNDLSKLDLSGLYNLLEVNCGLNNISDIDLSGATNLIYLSCSFNEIQQIDLSETPQLYTLNVDFNQLSTIDVSGLKELEEFGCNGNNIEELSVSDLSNLETLWCQGNDLKELNVNKLPKLHTLDCSENKLTSLNVKDLTNLIYLNCSQNELSTLEVSQLKKLFSFSCEQNNLDRVDVLGLNELNFFRCDGNPLSYLRIPDGTELTLESTGNGYISVWTNVDDPFSNLIGLEVVPEEGADFAGWNELPEDAVSAKWGSQINDPVTISGWCFRLNQDTKVSAEFSSVNEKKYNVIEGANFVWNSYGEPMTIRADGEFEKFTAVKIDDTLVEKEFYSAKEGSTIISLRPEFLQTLSVGKHSLEIVFTDGSAKTQFEIVNKTETEQPGNGNTLENGENEQQKPNDQNEINLNTEKTNLVNEENNSPKTGDEIEIYGYVILLILCMSISGIMFVRKRQ